MKSQPQFTTSTLSPSIIPALPGYRVVQFYMETEITPETTIHDIEMNQSVVVAWLVRPQMRLDEGHSLPEVIDHGLEPLYLFGGTPKDDDLIVDPLGQWTAYEQTFPDEAAARAWWLDRASRGGKANVPEVNPHAYVDAFTDDRWREEVRRWKSRGGTWDLYRRTPAPDLPGTRVPPHILAELGVVPLAELDRRNRLSKAIAHFRGEWRQGWPEEFLPGSRTCTTTPEIIEEARITVERESQAAE